MLKRHGIVKQVRLERLICLEHQRVVPPSMLEAHIHSHKSHKRYPKAAVLHAICEELGVKSDPPMPDVPTDRPKWYQGLDTAENGVQCRLCQRGYRDMDSLRSHWTDKHKSEGPCRARDMTFTAMQHFARAGNAATQWFPVSLTDRRLTNPDLGRLLKDVEKVRASKAKVAAKDLDPRLIEPWLLFTSWHLLFDGYDNVELVKLIDLPDASPKRSRKDWNNLSQLQTGVDKAMAAAERLIKATHEIARCKLNTPEGSG